MIALQDEQNKQVCQNFVMSIVGVWLEAKDNVEVTCQNHVTMTLYKIKNIIFIKKPKIIIENT